jgi:hypothetical protein
MKTVYDIFILNPNKTLVACTWRSDYAIDLLDKMTTEHCSDTCDRWTGGAIWREVETSKGLCSPDFQ